jgi:hypothetical protein
MWVFEDLECSAFHPQLFYLLHSGLRVYPAIFVEVLFPLVAADLHDEKDGGSGKEFIGAKGLAGSMGGDPGPFGTLDFYDFVSLPIEEFDGLGEAGEIGDQLDLHRLDGFCIIRWQLGVSVR